MAEHTTSLVVEEDIGDNAVYVKSSDDDAWFLGLVGVAWGRKLHGDGRTSDPVALANARLWAAAPDMLAALEAIVSDIDSDPTALPGGNYAVTYTRYIAQARAAIKKARGEQP